MLATVLVMLASACGGTDGPDRDWAAEARDQLVATGADAELADCVINLGRRELTRGPLSEAAADELARNCRAAQDVLNGAEPTDEPDEELAMVDLPWSLGDDPTLDRLWTACAEGSGAACDQLFEQSPVGSDYENFGVSCGQRPDLLHCAELDVIDPDAQDQ